MGYRNSTTAKRCSTILTNLIPTFMGHIEEIRDFLLARGRVTASFTGFLIPAFDTDANPNSANGLTRCGTNLLLQNQYAFQQFDTPPREGLAGPIQIAHCAHVMPAPHYSHPDSQHC